MYVKNRIICTVGRSLLTNFERENPKLKENFSSEEILNTLLKLDPSDRRCGAEINSTNSIIKKGALSQLSIITFLVSDTKDGEKTGQILKAYFSHPSCPIRFQNVRVKKISGLNGENKENFRKKGLKEVAKAMTELSTEVPELTVINATGGYKAQISFAVLLGQILKIKVYYMFEMFNEIIELPPLPVSFDYSLWVKNYDLLELLEQGTFNGNLVKNSDERLKVLYEVERGGNEKLYILNAMGIIFHRSFKEFFKKDESFLPPKRSKEAKYIANSKEGHSRIFDDKYHISKKLLQIPYITKLVCNYYNPKGGDFTNVKFKENMLEITFAKNGQCIGFTAETTANTDLEKDALKIFISEKMKEW